MASAKKTTKYKLVPSADGSSIIPEPYDDLEEPEPQPAEDGKYYLLSGDKSILLAWDLYERGIEAYCGVCRAPLKISRAYIFCPTDQKHFNVIV